jgi:hypothetical protein
VIPGVEASSSTVGPPLTDWARRGYIAGALRNTPENLVAFLVSPKQIEPEGGMPDMGVSLADANDMATYLFTLGAPEPGTLGPPQVFSREALEEMIRR